MDKVRNKNMGWSYGFVGFGKTRKQCVEEQCIRGYYNILRIEEKGSNVWAILEDKESGQRYGGLYLTSYKDGEFGYKVMTVAENPFYYNCSKTFYEMCKEIYKDDDDYAKRWLNNWQENYEVEKKRKEKIKNLKVGDRVKFLNANYANQAIWTISNILKGGKVLFEGYNLRNWKQRDFEVLDKDYVVTLQEKYIKAV